MLYKGFMGFLHTEQISLDASFLCKIVRCFGIQLRNNQLFLLKVLEDCFLSGILISVGICFALERRGLAFEQSCLLLLVVIYCAGKGISTYKKLYVISYEPWALMAPINNRKIFYSQLVVEWLFSFVYSGAILFCLTSSFILVGSFFGGLYHFCFSVVLGLFVFLISGLLYSRYVYHLVTKQIRWTRFLLYFGFAGILCFITKKVVQFAYKVLFSTHFPIHNFTDVALETWADKVDYEFQNQIHLMTIGIEKICQFETTEVGLALLVGILLLLSVPPKFIPIEGKVQTPRDLLYDYVLILKKIGKKNYVFQNLVGDILTYRWEFVRPAPQLFLVEYESIVCFALCYSILPLVNSLSLSVHILLVCNLQVLALQSKEIRSELAAFFNLSSNNNLLELLYFSVVDKSVVKEKEHLLECMMVPTMVILSLYDLIGSFAMGYPIIGVGFCVFVVFGSRMYGLIQTYMLPDTINISCLGKHVLDDSFEEAELADKMQEYPRVLLNMLPMYYTFFFPVFPNIQGAMFVAELAYLAVVCLMILFVCTYYEKRREKNIYKKI